MISPLPRLSRIYSIWSRCPERASDPLQHSPVMAQTIVTTEDGQQLANKIASHGVITSFLETSAKTGTNVEAAFLELAIKILEAGGLA